MTSRPLNSATAAASPRRLTRRSLLAGSGVVGAAALLAGVGRVDMDTLLRRASTDPLPTGSPILVVVTLYGGNDWLNTVVPYADSAYQSARPGLRLSGTDVLDLGDGMGLNPGLRGLADEWAAGRLAILRGVGLPRPDRSHFRAMDIWQTGSPDTPADTGWLGRWLDSTGADPLQALNIGATLPPMFAGRHCAAATLVTGAGTNTAAGSAAGVAGMTAMAARDPDDGPAAAMVTASYAAYAAVARLPATPPSRSADLSVSMQLVADLIRSGAPPRVYGVSLDGFDTHADELDRQRALLTELDAGLTTLRRGLAGHARAADIVTLVYSEFGRRVAANGSDGTDHGSAGNVLLLGDRVAGGWFGEQPSLTSLVDGDLRVTTDFRDVYAAVLTGALGSDPDQILGSGRRPVPGLWR